MADPRTNDKKVTQDDVAKRAGVTRSMVSYVLNGSDRSVAPETRDRILAAIDELGYRPNKFAQSLGTGKNNPLASRQIGLVLNSVEVFRRPYYAEILAGIHAKAHEENYHIRFIRFFDELRDPVLFNSLIHDEEVCGLILIALDQSVKSDADEVLVAQIQERIDNIVCVEWQHPGLPSVTFDRHEAAVKATNHLLGLGHQAIAYIGESDQRTGGFRRAMREAGLNPPQGFPMDGAADMKGGYAAASTLLAAHPEVTAVVAGSDEVAIGILRWLSDQGTDVPERIALVSIDNIEMAEFTTPPLTTIHVEKTGMGRQAVQRILQYEAEGERHDTTVLLPSRLVVRRSCGSASNRV